MNNRVASLGKFLCTIWRLLFYYLNLNKPVQHGTHLLPGHALGEHQISLRISPQDAVLHGPLHALLVGGRWGVIHGLSLQSLLELRPLLGIHQIRRAVFSCHVEVAVHISQRDAVLFHQLPAQGGGICQGCFAGLINAVADGIAHLNADAVGVGDHPIHRPAAGLVGVGVLLTAHRPGHLQIRHRTPDRGIVHKVVGAGLHDIVLKIGGVVGCLVPVVAGVVEHQVFDLIDSPGTAIVPGVG